MGPQQPIVLHYTLSHKIYDTQAYPDEEGRFHDIVTDGKMPPRVPTKPTEVSIEAVRVWREIRPALAISRW